MSNTVRPFSVTGTRPTNEPRTPFSAAAAAAGLQMDPSRPKRMRRTPATVAVPPVALKEVADSNEVIPASTTGTSTGRKTETKLPMTPETVAALDAALKG